MEVTDGAQSSVMCNVKCSRTAWTRSCKVGTVGAEVDVLGVKTTVKPVRSKRNSVFMIYYMGIRMS